MSRIRLNQEFRNKIGTRMRVHLEQEQTQEKEKWREIKEMYPPALWFANIGLVIIALLVILFV